MMASNAKRPSLPGIVTAANAVFVLLLYLSERFIAERHWLTTFVTYAPQQLFVLPLLVPLISAVVRRRWRMALANVAVALFFLVTALGFNVPLHRGHSAVGPSVRIMTYNIHHGEGGVDAIVRDVEAAHADVVCFQEINADGSGPAPKDELERRMAGWDYSWRNQTAVFSRFPITRFKVHRMPTRHKRLFLEVGIRPYGRQLTVIALHLDTALDSSSLTRHGGSLASYLRGSAEARSQQVNEVLSVTQNIPGPIAICGDFNTPPRGRIYRRMASRFNDCFRSAGWGFGYSFRSDIPVMRIDYIWAGEGLAPTYAAAVSLTHSDHRPVVADISFTR